MRSAQLIKVALLILAAPLCAQTRTNPHAQITWPAGCSLPGQVYSVAVNACVTASGIGVSRLPTSGGTMTSPMFGTSATFSGIVAAPTVVATSAVTSPSINQVFYVPLATSDVSTYVNTIFTSCKLAGIGCDVVLSGQIGTSATTITVPISTGVSYRLRCESGGGIHYTGTATAVVLGGAYPNGNYSLSDISNCAISGTAAAQGGILVTGVDFGFFISSVYVTGFTNGYGVRVDGVVSGTVRDSSFVSSKYGVDVAGVTSIPSGANAVTFSNVTVSANTSWGIYQEGVGAPESFSASQGVKYAGIKAELNGTSGNTSTGNIFIQDGLGTSVECQYCEQATSTLNALNIKIGDANFAPQGTVISAQLMASFGASSIYVFNGNRTYITNVYDVSGGDNFHTIQLGTAQVYTNLLNIVAPALTIANLVLLDSGALPPSWSNIDGQQASVTPTGGYTSLRVYGFNNHYWGFGTTPFLSTDDFYLCADGAIQASCATRWDSSGNMHEYANYYLGDSTVAIPSTATGYIGTATGKVTLSNGTPAAGTYPDGAAGTWTPLPVTKSGTPTVGAGVCWKTATQLGTCTAGTWPTCTTCN